MNITREQFQLMVEDITSELVQILVEQYSFNISNAIDTVYSSKTYEALIRPSTGLYNQSTGYVFAYLKQELVIYPSFDDSAPSNVAEQS